MVGGVGQRMLGSVSKRMAGEFFGNVGARSPASAGAVPEQPAAAGAAPAEVGAVFTAPPRPRGVRSAGRLPQGHRASAPGWCCSGSLVGRRSSGGGDDGADGARRLDRPDHGGRGPPPRDLRARAARPAPGPDRRAQPASSTRSSPSTRSAPGRAPPPPTRRSPRGAEVGPLHGLPFAFKDTHAVAGWRTTFGSPLFADHVPEHDELIVERIRARRRRRRSARPTCRSSPPARTRSTRSSAPPSTPSTRAGRPAARSGGAACALAAGHGAAGRRLRHGRLAAQPGVVLRRGRPAPDASAGCRSGRTDNQWETTSVGGPMARNVGDLALLLSVMAGPDPRAPQALGDPGVGLRAAARRLAAGLRVAVVHRPRRAAFEVDHEVRGRRRGSGGRFAAAGADGRRRRTPTSPRPTTPSAPCAPGTSRPSFGALLAEHPDDVQAVARRQHPGRRGPHRRRRGPRLRPAHHAVGADAACSSPTTTCWCCRPRRCRRSRPTRSSPPRSTAGRWRPTSTGCGRRTSSPSPAAPRSRCRPAPPPTGCRSASRSSPRTARDRRLLEVAAAFEQATRHGDRRPDF